MRQPFLFVAAVTGCLLLGGFSASVQPHTASGMAPDGLSQRLADETRNRLDAEFQQQSVAFELSGARTWPAANGHVRILAEGTADFGAEGSTMATVEAVYDQASGRWLQLDYILL